jgi:hypothetical protein
LANKKILLFPDEIDIEIPPEDPHGREAIRMYRVPEEVQRSTETAGEVYKKSYIHTTHALSPKGQQKYLRYSSEIPTFYQN